MSTINPLPTKEAIAQLLTELVGKRTTVKVTTPFAVTPKTPAIVALFNRDNGEAAGAWACDLAFAARVGACLTMIPKGASDECANRAQLTDAIYENVREIFNVASNLFNVDGAPHTRLISVHTLPKEQMPEPLAALLAKPAGSRHLEVSVDGYGVGRASIHVM